METWATIGGRIEDYAFTYKTKGKAAARREITADYGKENAGAVFAGLVIYIEKGVDAYYGI